MDEFCSIDEGAEKAQRPEWESRILQGSLLTPVSRTQYEVDIANEEWGVALSLKKTYGNAQAVHFCRACLGGRLMMCSRITTKPNQTFLVRCFFVQLIRFWAADVLKKREDEEREARKKKERLLEYDVNWFFERKSVLARCVKEKLEQHIDTEDLETISVVLCFCLGLFDDEWTKYWAFGLLALLEKSFGPTHYQTVIFVEFLAESILFNSDYEFKRFYRGEAASEEKQQIVERHLWYLEQEKGKPRVSSLCFWYYLGLKRLSSQNEEEIDSARPLIDKAFKKRVESLGESHVESITFTTGLLDEFCAKHSGKSNSRGNGGHIKVDPHPIIIDLLRLCYETNRLAEAEILIYECLSHKGVFETTDPESGLLRLDSGTAQYLIASQNVPGSDIHWENPYTYLRCWFSVALEPASPPDFFPMAPVQLMVWPDRIDLATNTASLDDLGSLLNLKSDKEILKEIRNLTTWSCLELMQAKVVPQDHLRKSTTMPSVIWLFPELHFTSRPLERAASAMVPFGDDDRSYVNRDAQRENFKQVLSYSVEDLSSKDMHVTTSYIPYEYFQALRAFRGGFTYVEYLDVLRDIMLPRCPSVVETTRKRLCLWARPSKSLPCWQLPSKPIFSTNSNQIEEPKYALFNSTPCGPVYLDAELILGGNVMSSRWIDWTSYTVNRTVDHLNPKLKLSNGGEAWCHGYIMGTLWDGTLENKWTGIRIFVVDVDLRVEGSNKSYNFFINPKSFTERNTQPVNKSVENEFCDEMNRREVWDRDFEKQIAKVKAADDDVEEALATWEAEKAKENEQRIKWDEEQALKRESQSPSTASIPMGESKVKGRWTSKLSGKLAKLGI